MTQDTGYETSLVGRVVQLLFPNGRGGFDHRKPRGRVLSAYPGSNGGLHVWLQVEDLECATSFWYEKPDVGDVVMVSTAGECGQAMIRVIQEPTIGKHAIGITNQPGTRALVRRIIRHLEEEGDLTPMNVIIDILGASQMPYQLMVLTDPDPTKAPTDRLFIANGPDAEPDPELMAVVERCLVRPEAS